MNDRFARTDDVELDSRALYRALGRSLPFLIPFVIVAMLVVFFGLGLLTPRYSAQTMVLIQQGESSITQGAGGTDEVRSLLDAEGVASQVQLIASRDLAESVVKSLDLASLPEFDQPTFADNIQALLARYGLGKVTSDASRQERVLQRFANALQVYPVDKTRVITIAFSSSDPALSARVANAVADEYLTLDRDAKRATNADATHWLETQIADLRTRLSGSEAKVESFRAENGLFMGGQNGTTSLPQQRLDDLNAEFARLEGARAASEAKATTIRKGLQNGGSLDVPEVLDSQLIQRLREQQVALRAQIAQLSATLLSNHPRIRELNAQLGDLDGQIRSEAGRILKSLENEVETAKAREAEIGADIQRTKSQTAQSNDAEVKLRALQREASSQRDLLETYLRRYREATSRQDGDYLPADARVISRASVPIEPSFPRRVPITAAFGVALLLLSVAFVLLRELMSGRALRPIRIAPMPPAEPGQRWPEGGDVRRLMPAEPSPPPSIAPEQPDRLRPLVDRLRDLEARRVVLLPIEAGEGGRPLAAVALARQLSRRGNRVLLLDLHADGADGAAMAPQGEKLPGFADLFAGSATFAQTIFRDRYSRAHLIPRGRTELPEGFAATERFETILDALDHTYEHVLIDADKALGPLLAPDAAAIVLLAEEATTEEVRDAAIATFRALGPAEILVLVAEAEPASIPEDAAVA
ncbi:GumC family protein [Kaistia algarum]|uniref:GumC family protein n=1 Tax=Kaistia algarum TaxID=2083279 RepID=UPI001402FDF8|nr:chain-length determining protein [Kaistia algarum]MCX5514938.1 chain-length determining protein [Kaistia algarum]